MKSSWKWGIICLLLFGIFLVGIGAFQLNRGGWGEDRIEILKDDYTESNKNISQDFQKYDLINLNDALRDDLIDLPGIGEKLADKIISGRPYKDTSEIIIRKIISQKVFEEIKDRITVW
ncbi:MAG: hypothetical protein UU93_C0007G0023 [Candidatus Amesbacteria bacterium GW2011_GWA2_42_12]|uniref:Helix-hairpin-helix motif protein n=1 Tax=Candidatus Amesbacteria bacterium GW2011_GWA2_42_12 TaxID=1618356 RepID=A0A0G1B4E4_9BACT|nr:MAG: hypothetical protein UU93_C0007G0023 [Candidatus Amesbacteria bacterium GW2011_GWA2_42_12]